jgi:hypothetical protein
MHRRGSRQLWCALQRQYRVNGEQLLRMAGPGSGLLGEELPLNIHEIKAVLEPKFLNEFLTENFTSTLTELYPSGVTELSKQQDISFLCGLFNDAARTYEFIPSNIMMVNKQ